MLGPEARMAGRGSKSWQTKAKPPVQLPRLVETRSQSLPSKNRKQDGDSLFAAMVGKTTELHRAINRINKANERRKVAPTVDEHSEFMAELEREAELSRGSMPIRRTASEGHLPKPRQRKRERLYRTASSGSPWEELVQDTQRRLAAEDKAERDAANTIRLPDSPRCIHTPPHANIFQTMSAEPPRHGRVREVNPPPFSGEFVRKWPQPHRPPRPTPAYAAPFPFATTDPVHDYTQRFAQPQEHKDRTVDPRDCTSAPPPSTKPASGVWRPWQGLWSTKKQEKEERADTSPEPRAQASQSRDSDEKDESAPSGCWPWSKGCKSKDQKYEQQEKAKPRDQDKQNPQAQTMQDSSPTLVAAATLIDQLEELLQASAAQPFVERRRVFRDLQRRFHPDKNIEDPESAKLVFQHLMDRQRGFLRT
eukprot:TRINITY_DN64683_c0_g1_i1.p1 TRINITY_DN64683_c0_g1~~TRINITY_DN64683_c0_g1_i1.p1  ORF type:complete len:449 (-),score=61.12 TRINITY_DN64683_c0_g1_i1:93-1355(-)